MDKRRVYQSPAIGRKIKQLKKNEKRDLDQAISEMLNNPAIGEEKAGDLAGVFVYKFRVNKKLTLVSYVLDSESITLIAFGSHKNFYQDLKNYRKG